MSQMSQKMSDRIYDISKRRIDARKANPRPREPGNSYTDPIGAILLNFLYGAETDECAENLIRLLEDWEARGEGGAIADVFSGRVDLVELLRRNRPE